MNPFPKNTAQLDEQAEQEAQLMQLLKNNPDLLKKYQEQMTKMQGKQKNRVVQQPMTSKQYHQKVKEGTIEQFLDEEGGLVIQPDKGIVLKLFDRHSGQKIFVNVLKHPGVDHPQEKLLVDLQNQAGLRIPMSVGRVREDSDKKGTPCKVVDVVMNDKIVENAEKNSDIFFFMAQIISNYLLEKYKIPVVEDNIVKVNMKYKGSTVQIQRIRAKKNPKIQQVSSQEEPKSKEQFEEQQKLLNQLSGNTGKQQKRPQFKLTGVGFNGEKEQYSMQNRGQVKALELQFDLSLLIHSKGIHLEGSDRIVYLFVRGLYEICLRLPQQISTYTAVFSRKQRVLRLNCDVKQQQSQQQSSLPSKKVEIKIESELLDQLV